MDFLGWVDHTSVVYCERPCVDLIYLYLVPFSVFSNHDILYSALILVRIGLTMSSCLASSDAGLVCPRGQYDVILFVAGDP